MVPGFHFSKQAGHALRMLPALPSQVLGYAIVPRSSLQEFDGRRCVQPTSVIAQKPISEMMDSADVPRNLLPIPHSRTNSRTNSSSMQALQRKVLSQGSPANGAGGGSNPRANSHSLKGLHSHSVRTRSLSRSDGRNSGRGSAKKGSKGSPRPLGEHGEAHGVQMQIVEDDMQVDSEVTLSLQCSTPNGPESARGV